jgi:hypothetical protein
MPETTESVRDAARELTAAQFAILWRLYARAESAARGNQGGNPDGDVGVIHNALMESAAALRGFGLTLEAMRQIWDEAYALGRADERGDLLAEMEARDRPRLQVV